MKLECGSCGAQYPGDLNKQWGKTRETNGLGPSVRCPALVPNGLTAPDGSEAHEVCGGFLGPIPDAAAAPARLVALTPN